MLIFKDISKYIGLFVSSCVVFVAVFLCASFMLPNISANATTEYESGYIYIYDVADSVTVFYSDETTEIVELVENSYVKISLEDVDQIYIDKSLTDDIYVSYDGGENYVSMSSVTETGCLNTAAINILIVANKSDAESTGNESTDNEPADENDGSSSGSGVTSTDDVGDNEVDKITITYNIDGELSTEDIEYGDAVSMDNPTKEGYEFLGWSTETSVYKGSAIFLEDVVWT
ncbi:MAG: InlB B-repeat-containing protein, partial [Bacillota bacterium]